MASAARGRGIGAALYVHSIDEARRSRFLAMQFYIVVSTNTSTVRLWQRHGFEIAGTLPKAFRHAWHGLVDAYVMYRELTPIAWMWLAGSTVTGAIGIAWLVRELLRR